MTASDLALNDENKDTFLEIEHSKAKLLQSFWVEECSGDEIDDATKSKERVAAIAV